MGLNTLYMYNIVITGCLRSSQCVFHIGIRSMVALCIDGLLWCLYPPHTLGNPFLSVSFLFTIFCRDEMGRGISMCGLLVMAAILTTRVLLMAL